MSTNPSAFVASTGGQFFAASGLTGATAASRYVGATTSGAPGSGTFAVGDYVVDQTGAFWVCTTAGSPGTWAEVAQTAPTPAANSLLGWTSDAAAIPVTPGQLTIGGTLYLMAITLAQAVTLNNIWFCITAAAVTPTAGESQVGLYNAAGSLVASATTTATATAMVGTNATAFPLSASYAAAPGTYWVGAVFQAATEPTLARASTSSVLFNNAGVTSAAKFRFCVNGTGITTALPLSITPASNSTTNAFAFWAGVS